MRASSIAPHLLTPPHIYLASLALRNCGGTLSCMQEGNKHLNPQFKKRPRVTEVLHCFILPAVLPIPSFLPFYLFLFSFLIVIRVC